MKTVCAGLLLLALLSTSSPSDSFDLYGRFGMCTFAADDLDRVFEGIEDGIAAGGLAADFKGPTNGIDLTGGVRHAFLNWMSLGIEAGATFDLVTNNSSRPTLSYSNKANTKIYELVGLVEIHPPTAPMLHFGFGGGYASASHVFTQDLMYDPEGAPPRFFDSKLEADGGGPTWMVFAGVESPYPTGVLLMARVGYRYRNLGSFEGTLYDDGVIVGTAPVLDNSGAQLDFDFSGLFGHIGIGYRFGVADGNGG